MAQSVILARGSAWLAAAGRASIDENIAIAKTIVNSLFFHAFVLLKFIKFGLLFFLLKHSGFCVST